MDWPAFLRHNNIDFVEAGRNVSKDNIAVRCPFCSDDPSQHLNISTKGKGWFCYRDRQHSGKSDTRLVQALLRVSYEQALAIVQGGAILPDNFYERVVALLSPEAQPAMEVPPPMPPDFRPMNDKAMGRVTFRPFRAYLHDRGYSNHDITTLHRRFHLHWATHGAFKGRIIFPVYFDGRLATWTGRTILPHVDLRYKTLSTDPDKAEREAMPLPLGPISSYLLWWDDLLKFDGADTIILCEGPFDALRINQLGWTRGIVATCFFTAQPGPAQIDLLHELLPRYDRRYLLLDADAWAATMHVGANLSALDIEPLQLPPDVKDPGEMTWPHLRALL